MSEQVRLQSIAGHWKNFPLIFRLDFRSMAVMV
jgi:hypothetical protein